MFNETSHKNFYSLLYHIIDISLYFSSQFPYISQATLIRGIEAFEEKNYGEAARILYPLRRAGAIVPFKYLEYMKTHKLAEVNDNYATDFEPIPTEGYTLSNSFLQASLGSIELKSNKQQGVKKLEPLILSGNVRAITLLEKEFETDQKILSFFKNKQLKNIKSKNEFSIYLKFTKLGPIALSNGVDLSRLFALNDKDFSPEFNKAVKTFKVNIQKYPDHIGNMAFQVAKLDKDRPFWHFLALENGETASYLPLAKRCLEAVNHQVANRNQGKLNQTTEEDISVFRYYASKLQKNSLGDPQELGKLFSRYGTLLGEGYGGKKDLVKERWCYKMSAKKGNLAAYHNYAYMLEEGEGGDKDPVGARRYYKIAADLGYEKSLLNYALMLLEGEGGDKDPIKARQYFKMAAERGWMMGHYHLALMAEAGEGGDVNFDEALENFKKAADLGRAEAQYAYGRRLQERRQENDLSEARRYYKMAADQERAEAQTNYARMAYEGEGGAEDLAEAFLYSEKAAKQEYAIAQHNCGILLWHGIGCKKNPQKALAYFQKSAAQGYTDSLVLLQKLKRALLKEKEESSKIEPSSKEILPQKIAEDNALFPEENVKLENEIPLHDQHIDLSNPNILKIVTTVFDKNLDNKNIFSSSKRLNLQDITFNIEHNNSTHYMFNGEIFKPSHFESSHKFIRESVLKDIIEKLDYVPNPNSEKLPNVAEGFITIHYEEDGISKHKVINLDERYLSGKKYFRKDYDLEFKRIKHIINAVQDVLDKSEQKKIYKLTPNKRGIALAEIMEEKLRQQIIGNPWKNNCLDSEAILLLRLVQRFPSFLSQLHGETGKDSVITITGLVLGISSYRDCCLKCQRLIQGFQWAAKDILQNAMDERMRIDDHFGTLAITYGHTRLKFREGKLEPEFLNTDVVLKPGVHKLIRCRATPQ